MSVHASDPYQSPCRKPHNIDISFSGNDKHTLAIIKSRRKTNKRQVAWHRMRAWLHAYQSVFPGRRNAMNRPHLETRARITRNKLKIDGLLASIGRPPNLTWCSWKQSAWTASARNWLNLPSPIPHLLAHMPNNVGIAGSLLG